MRPDDASRLADILVAAREAIALTDGVSQAEYVSNRTLQLALVKLIEVVGEAASQLTQAKRAEITGVPWSDVIGMRHRLVHDYMSVDLDVVWEVVSDDLPGLIASIERLGYLDE